MKKQRILSRSSAQADGLPASPPPASAPMRPAHGLAAPVMFDTCHIGVVMRTLLFVETVLAIASLFGSEDAMDWLANLAILTAGAFPATLAWLLLGCACKRRLALWPSWLQQCLGLVGGAAAGVGCVAILHGIGSGPAGWATWSGAAAAGAFVAALVLNWLAARARARAPAAERARWSDLQARVRPHFLFNTLNSAIALVRADPPGAERLLEDLSDLFRAALEDGRVDAFLDDEIELARRYLAIEQARFGERLCVRWQLDPCAGGARVPRLLLQPLLENAVRHGLEPSEQNVAIEVRTRRLGNRVSIEVDNTTPAGGGASGHGIGLASVRERLALMHDVQAQIDTVQRDGRFCVRIELPADAASSAWPGAAA